MVEISGSGSAGAQRDESWGAEALMALRVTQMVWWGDGKTMTRQSRLKPFSLEVDDLFHGMEFYCLGWGTEE